MPGPSRIQTHRNCVHLCEGLNMISKHTIVRAGGQPPLLCKRFYFYHAIDIEFNIKKRANRRIESITAAQPSWTVVFWVKPVCCCLTTTSITIEFWWLYCAIRVKMWKWLVWLVDSGCHIFERFSTRSPTYSPSECTYLRLTQWQNATWTKLLNK